MAQLFNNNSLPKQTNKLKHILRKNVINIYKEVEKKPEKTDMFKQRNSRVRQLIQLMIYMAENKIKKSQHNNFKKHLDVDWWTFRINLGQRYSPSLKHFKNN